MNNLIQLISNFVNDIYTSLITNLDNVFGGFTAFTNKNILNGTLLNVSLTYGELLTYVLTITILILLISFVIKTFNKLLGLL